MESFRQTMAAEGCSSSESGWTMYIASPMPEDDDAGCTNIENEEYDGGLFHGESRRLKKRDEEESDDSMASDASSGPNHNHHSSYAHNTSSHGSTAASKKDKKDHASKCNSSRKNANYKQDKKRLDSRSK